MSLFQQNMERKCFDVGVAKVFASSLYSIFNYSQEPERNWEQFIIHTLSSTLLRLVGLGRRQSEEMLGEMSAGRGSRSSLNKDVPVGSPSPA